MDIENWAGAGQQSEAIPSLLVSLPPTYMRILISRRRKRPSSKCQSHVTNCPAADRPRATTIAPALATSAPPPAVLYHQGPRTYSTDRSLPIILDAGFYAEPDRSRERTAPRAGMGGVPYRAIGYWPAERRPSSHWTYGSVIQRCHPRNHAAHSRCTARSGRPRACAAVRQGTGC
jgi:hypothetical protein